MRYNEREWEEDIMNENMIQQKQIKIKNIK